MNLTLPCWFDRRKALYVLLAVSVMLSVPYVNCLGDDTFIYMRMIRNLLETGRFEYNPGEPCYAMTSVTWFLAWAGATALLGSMDLARYVLSPLFHLAAFAGLYLIGRRLLATPRVRWLALAAIVLDPFYLRWFWAGWEVSPKIAAAAWALVALLWAGERPQSHGRAVLAGLAVGFAFLTRPELLILAPLGFLYLAVRKANDARMGRLVGYVIGLIVITMPWLFYARAVFGWWLPHTVFAKTGAAWAFADYAKFAALLVVPYAPFYVWVARAAIPLAREARALPSGLRSPEGQDLALVLVFGAGAAGYAVSGSFLEQIKLALFVPFIILSAAVVLDRAVRRRALRLGPRAVAVIALLTLAVSLFIQAPWLERYSLFSSRFREGVDRDFIAFAREVRERMPPGATIGLWELGVVGYVTDRYVIDFAGLATPELTAYKLRYPPPPRPAWDGLFKCMPEYVNAYVRDTGRVPDYLFECVPMGDEETHGRAQRNLFGEVYVPVHTQRAQRVFVRRQPAGHDYLMILYERRNRG